MQRHGEVEERKGPQGQSEETEGVRGDCEGDLEEFGILELDERLEFKECCGIDWNVDLWCEL